MPTLSILPFALLLIGIAVLPLLKPQWWESNRNKAKFAGLLAIPMLAWLAYFDWHMILHAGEEYFSFICLLGSLFIISGGIVMRGEIKPTPAANAGLLVAGTLLASFIGTTGASMLLIRPYLRANRIRSSTRHLPIFFIFCVSNCGGLLTPLGDPPLFLGFLRGVPFTWTFILWKEWLLVNTVIISLFTIIDWRLTKQEGGVPDIDRQPISVVGLHNLIFLAGVVASAALLPLGWRELGMIIATLGSLFSTKRALRDENGFTYHPISEVAILFAAIFTTMQPALGLLQVKGPGLGLSSPDQFYFMTGVLSSVLDNAPTYVTFFTIAQSLPSDPGTVLIAGVAEPVLIGISLGAVFMGANTYIGNGPNFMVKSICDEAGFKTPSFFGYMLWSVGILGPLWLVVAWLFVK